MYIYFTQRQLKQQQQQKILSGRLSLLFFPLKLIFFQLKLNQGFLFARTHTRSFDCDFDCLSTHVVVICVIYMVRGVFEPCFFNYYRIE